MSNRRGRSRTKTHASRGEGAGPAPSAAAHQPATAREAGGDPHVVQRQATSQAPAPATVYEGAEGRIVKDRELVLPALTVPTFKAGFGRTNFRLPRRTDEERDSNQRQIWEEAARQGTRLGEKLDDKLRQEGSPRATRGGQPIYFLALRNVRDNYVIGNRTTVLNRALRPFWDRAGNRVFYDVDHQEELQLGGRDAPENLWLLESEANRSSGRNIRGEKIRRIQTLLNAATGRLWTTPPEVDTVRRTYDIDIRQVAPGLPVAGDPSKRWTLDQIKAGDSLDGLHALSRDEITRAGLEGTPARLAIFTSESGGGVRFIDWQEGSTTREVTIPLGQNFGIERVSYSRGSESNYIEGTAFRGQGAQRRILEETTLRFPIRQSDAVEYGGAVPQASVTNAARSALRARGMSPIVIEQAELDPTKGIVARGKLLPTVPLFARLEIDIVIDGNNVYLSKRFSPGDFSIPGPIQVTESSLEIFAGTQGIGFNGAVLFEVQRLGRGRLAGEVSTGEGVALSGEFNFDSNLFEPARVEVWYRARRLGGRGRVVLKNGVVRGVRSASIEVLVDDRAWSITGSLEPDMRGIESATVRVGHTPEAGLTGEATLLLTRDNPLIRGGSAVASFRQRPGGEGYLVTAHGQATVGFHGITATIDVDYDDGAFTARGTVPFERGMLNGSITLGVTNRAVSDDGQLSGPPTEVLTPFGAGTVTITFTPWLRGTAGIRLLPNGEIEISGRVGLPSAVDIFPVRQIERRIFSINLDIPLVGVAVAGQRVGIFATVSGGLDASTGFGPGQIRDLSLEVTYNPAHEEETRIIGHGLFYIPAHAGLRLFVRGGVGAGIPFVSATAGLELGAQLGVDGAAEADVTVDWRPSRGLSLDAEGRIYAEPRFTFDVTAFVQVTADLVIDTVELYNQRWQLASFEHGSNLRFGVTFPIHYREGQPFDISLSDVQFQVPDIDPLATLSGLIDRVIG